MLAHLADLSKYVHNVEFLEDQLKRAPLDPKLHRKMGSLLTSGGETAKARVYLESAYLLEQDPKRGAKGISILQNATSIAVPVKAASDLNESFRTTGPGKAVPAEPAKFP